MKISWKTGFSNPGKVKADAAYRELERIRNANDGQLRAANIVNESRPKNAVLHGNFEWDDAVAAEKHRLEQARCITRSLMVEMQQPVPAETRMYEIHRTSAQPNAPATKTQFYDTIGNILVDPEARQNLLKQAERDLRAFKTRYGVLSELGALMVKVEIMIKDIMAERECDSGLK